MSSTREETRVDEGGPIGEVAIAAPTVKDVEDRGGAGEAAGLLEVEAQLEVNPEISAAKQLEVSLLLSPVARLEAWMSLLPHTTSELLEELGGAYLFLVSGDGLLLHLLRKQHLDADVTKGFQPLRILYQAELLLQRIGAAGGHFKVVFFKAFAAAKAAHPLFCLLQQLLQLHLTKQKIEFLSLPNWWGPEFSAAIAAFHPLFMLLDDIHLPSLQEEMYEQEGDSEETDEDEEAETADTETEETQGGPRRILEKAGAPWTLPASVPLDICQLQADVLMKVKQQGARCMSLLLQSLCLSCCRLGVDIAFLQGLVVKPTKVFAPSASCYAGANIWRAMEMNIQGSSSSSSGEEAGEQQQQQCPLQRALGQHRDMLQSLRLLPVAVDEEQQKASKLLLQQLQQLQQQQQQQQQQTVPLRYLMVWRFFEFLKAAAADEDGEDVGYLQQFAAVGKLLLLAAALQQEVSLTERSHNYSRASASSDFVKEFLYAPLRLFFTEMHAALALANDLLQQQQQQQQQEQQKQQKLLLEMLDGKELADLFDGKLLVSLLGLAAAAARSSGNWSVSAAAVGLAAAKCEELECIWTKCREGLSSDAFFPVSLESLKSLLEDPAALPAPKPAKETAAAAAEQQRQKTTANLLCIQSTFLRRLRAGDARTGALPDVLVVDEEDEVDLIERDTRRQLLLQRQLLEETELTDSEDEASLSTQDAEHLKRVVELRMRVNEMRDSGEAVLVEDAPEKILQETFSVDSSRVPTRHEKQRMENMNGEEKRKFWEARLRRRVQQYLANITRTAKCICPHPLHFNIVVNHANHPWRALEQQQQEAAQAAAAGGKKNSKQAPKKEHAEKKEKPVAMKKADLIRAKNIQAKQQKEKDVDLERAENLENLLEALCAEKSALPKGKNDLLLEFVFKGRGYSLTPASLKELMLDCLVGSGRRMDLLLGLPAVVRILKTRERQKEFAMIVLELVNNAYKQFARERCVSKECFLEMRKLLCLLFRLNVEIARMFNAQLSPLDIKTIQSSLLSLGFGLSANLLFDKWKQQQIKQREALPLADAKAAKTSKSKKSHAAAGAVDDEAHRVKEALPHDFRIREGQEAEIQLRFMGGDFERTTRPPSLAKDPRVLFEPDSWQSRLFDAVDSYASAFVSAPTASGKTYVCFYAMELVLRDSNDGCVVYVCPNKALAQQVYAEIYGRFSSKTYPVNCKKILSGQVLQGVCTPNPLSAQVLVTVPNFLELMLMSGDSHIRQFCSNLKYVILDEVHCIADQEEGPKWERIFQLLPCPFLAMSATVGNSDSFLAWLRRSSPSKDIRYVSHMERFSDLHMHVYDEDKIIPLNPVAALHFNKIVGEGLANDFYVPPQDGLQLYCCLSRMLGPEHPFTTSFDPHVYFESTAAITKKQYSYYWQTMKGYLVSLIRDSKEITLEMFAQLQETLQESRPTWLDDLQFFSPLPALKKAAEAAAAAAPKTNKYAGSLRAMRNRDVFSKSYLDPEKLLALCRTLNNRQLLPCLIFNFSRFQVRRMANSLSSLLEHLQWEKYYGTEEAAYRTRAINKQRMEEYEALLLERETARKMRGMSRQQREAQGLDKQDLAALEETDEIPPPPGDIAEEIDDEFSFANPKAMGTNFDDIKAVLKDVKGRAKTPQDELLGKLLMRGVGLFDDGLSKGYRVAVELLYRWGFLRIIICTHALALGMNLPCKSAVFAGDALALTPTMFKQAGGRAGRRGYDSAGHIIFWEIPFRRVNRLLEARLPVFSGDFPVTPILALRALRLNSQLAVALVADSLLEDRLNRLFLNPLFSVSGTNHLPSERELEMLRFYIRYYARFAADLLLRCGVLCQKAFGVSSDASLNAFGFAAEFLYENGSGALLLLFILASGVFEDLELEQQTPQMELSNIFLQLCAFCCDPSATAEVSSNFLLQQLFEYRRAVARHKARQFALAVGDAAAAAKFAAAGPQREIRPFTKKFPAAVETGISAFNRMALSSTAGCLQAAASLVEQKFGKGEIEFCLPLTGLSFARDKPQETEGGDTLLKAYRDTVHRYSLQSPFAALGCMHDAEVSLSCEMLSDNLRISLPFQPKVMSAFTPLKIEKIPVLDAAANKTVFSEVYRHNSYMQDLYVHGKLTRVVKENGFAPESLWKMLHHFVSSLQHLQEGLLFISTKCSTALPANQLISACLSQAYERLKEVLREQSA